MKQLSELKKSYNKIFLFVLSMFAIGALIVFCAGFLCNDYKVTAQPLDEMTQMPGLSYEESVATKTRLTKPINPVYDAGAQDVCSSNPERGFYSTCPIVIGSSGLVSNIPAESSNTTKLLYLKVDLHAFSGTMNGTGIDMPLTSQALDALRTVIGKIRENDNTIILRFVYDNNATGIIPGVDKCEPKQDMLLRHIEQLSPVFQEYATTINVIQVGFYGLWGEAYYNTDAATTANGPSNYTQTINALLDATDGTDINIAVRTPQYYSWYRASNEGHESVSLANIDTDITESNEGAYRVTIFNDAYGASQDDLGTYANRQRELDWLSNQTRHAYYGGEALPDVSSPTAINGIGPYNTAMYFIQEAFTTHTSYVNWEWNQALHKEWANQIYTGSEKDSTGNLIYPGDDDKYKGQSGLRYIENHLGYRFVMRGSNTTLDVTSDPPKVSVGLAVENVGFGNLIKAKQADILLVDPKGNIEYTIENVDINAKDFLSSSTYTKKIEIELPSALKYMKTYRVYLRLSSGDQISDGKYYSAIRFANDGVWSEKMQANLIGYFNSPTGEDPGVVDPFEPEKEKVAFAVYSKTDNSLRFYKREQIPQVGDTFEERIVSNVYTDIETTDYYAWGDGLPGWIANAPFTGGNVVAAVMDEDITPISTAKWFSGWQFSSVDVTKLNTSRVTNMQEMFSYSTALEEIDLSTFDYSAVTNMHYMFADCSLLKNVYVSTAWNAEKAAAANEMFRNCTSIVGGLGTAWQGDEAEYRRIDAPGYPGYLIDKNAEYYDDYIYYANDVSDWNARPLGNAMDNKVVSSFEKSRGALLFNNSTWGISNTHSIEAVVIYSFNGIEKATYKKSELGENYIFVRGNEPDLSMIGGQSVLDENNGSLRFVLRVSEKQEASTHYTDSVYSVWTYDVWGGTNELSDSFANKSVNCFDKVQGAEMFNPETWGIPEGWEINKVVVYSPTDTWISTALAIYVKTTWTSDNGTTHERPSDFVFKRQDVSALDSTLDIDNGNLRFLVMVTKV